MRKIIYLILISPVILHPSSYLRADGGSVCLSERKGNYRITVFASPNPMRAGPVDISVFVQHATTLEPVSGARVTIKATRRGCHCMALHYPATTEAATNKLYNAANFDLPESGWYSVEVDIDGAFGEAQVRFDLEAAEAMPQFPAVWLWVGWPILAILFFGIHQFLVRLRSSRRG
jgi:hypothetical protein